MSNKKLTAIILTLVMIIANINFVSVAEYEYDVLGREEDNVYKTYHYDYRGSTTAITDITGNVTD
jgi:hypothetical protein